MKKPIAVALFVVAIIGLTGCAGGGFQSTYQGYVKNLKSLSSIALSLYGNLSDAEVIAKMRDQVTQDFLDPESARFRNERAVRRADGIYVCGEVNGKNSLGAYVGYKHYWATVGQAIIEGNRSSDTQAILDLCYRS